MSRSLQARSGRDLGAVLPPLDPDRDGRAVLDACRSGRETDDRLWRLLRTSGGPRRELIDCVRWRIRPTPEWSLHALVWRAALERDLAAAAGATLDAQAWQRVVERHLAPLVNPDVALSVELWRVRDQLDVALPPPESGHWVTLTHRGQRFLLYTYSEGSRTCGRGGPIAGTPTKAQLTTATARPSHTFKDLDAYGGAQPIGRAEIAAWGLPDQPSWLRGPIPR